MQLDTQKFTLAAAGTMGIAYVVCAIFIALWPDFSLQLFGWLVHLVNVDKFAGDVAITAGGVIAGLVQVLVYTYVMMWIFGKLHNAFLR